MDKTSDIGAPTQEVMYTFRFGTSKETVQLTQQQLDHFPYLVSLVTHADDFMSGKNETGEYVLSSQIRHNWFMAIFRSITTEHSSALFTELPQEANVFGLLQLYDYLCIDPLPVPLLKDKHLVRLDSNNIPNEKTRIEYRRAKNLLEVRDTAVQFIIALIRNEYNLDDSNTLGGIYSLIMTILLNPKVFGLRLCHHTLIVVKKFYFSLFSYKQQIKLDNAQESLQRIKAKSLTYLYDDHQPLPEHFDNDFALQGIYVVIEENINTNYGWKFNKEIIHDEHNFRYDSLETRTLYIENYYINWFQTRFFDEYAPLLAHWHRLEYNLRRELENYQRQQEHYLLQYIRSSINVSILYELLPVFRAHKPSVIEHPDFIKFLICQLKQEEKKNEAKSARSGCFNTLPKRPKIDKFKHRCGPKTQKYR
ncbi:unnamed protein product [Rotaria sp. Silwood2]|nr:unnamed protein product [Rotaria sp. Silwood2]CAF4473607.1 unnamed protein product [Rotaria sp. Silwood2]